MKMSLNESIQRLHEELKGHPWYLGIGECTLENKSTLIVYTKSKRHPELASLKGKWEGYEVITKAVGTIRPLTIEGVSSLG